MFARTLVALLFSVATSQVLAGKPIEAYVSPGHLFPMEGTVFMDRDEPTKRVDYKALPAYADRGGQQIGEVRLARPDCVGQEQLRACADVTPQWYLETARGKYPLEVAEYSYETAGLVSLHPVAKSGAVSWSRIDYIGGHFWVRTSTSAVFEHERLAHAVGDFDTWCRAPGDCGPVPRDMAQEVAKVAAGKYELEGCYGEAYEVKEVVTTLSGRYYHVTRANVIAGHPVPNLPAAGFIPTRDRSGKHTGVFYSRGC